MKKKILFILFMLFSFQGYSQNGVSLFEKAVESYENVNYEETLLFLNKTEKIVGANPKIESLKILAYDNLGDLKNTKLSLMKYYQLVSPEYLFTQAHKEIELINERVNKAIETYDKEIKSKIDLQRDKNATIYINNESKDLESKKKLLIQENKKNIEKILLYNASSDLKAKVNDKNSMFSNLNLDYSKFNDAKITFEDGIYIGELNNGVPHGKGEMKYNNGDVYNGNWEESEKNGIGTQKYINGDIYVGNWLNNKKEGNGSMTYVNKDIYKGVWKNDYYSKGELNKSNGDYFHGSFDASNIFISGKIKNKLPNGDLYEGDYLNKKYTGNATIEYVNRDKYEGGVIDGKKNGQGKLTYKNNNWRIGEWKDDKSFDTRKFYSQRVTLGSGYFSFVYDGVMQNKNKEEEIYNLDYLRAGLEMGMQWKWFHAGWNVGYLKLPTFIGTVNGVSHEFKHESGVFGIKAGPSLAFFKDHIIINGFYQLGYSPTAEPDYEDKSSYPDFVVHQYGGEIHFRHSWYSLGVTYGINEFKPGKYGEDFNTIDFNRKITTSGVKLTLYF